MEDPFVRARILFGSDGLDRLQNARVAIFGLGGVGSFAFEALVRSGVGALDLIDNDTVSLSNLNRQLLALRSTVGMRKTDVAAARAADINPSAPKSRWCCAAGTRACRSCAAWERATSSIRACCGSRTFPRRATATWPASCARSCAAAAWSI